MLVKVWMPNDSYIIMDEDHVDTYFDDDADIEIEELELVPEDYKVTNKEFKSLVGALDARFNHTYIDVSDEE